MIFDQKGLHMKGKCKWMLAAAVCGAMAVPAIAAEAPKELVLTGVVRDFKVSHPDFEAYPDAFGKGLVNNTLDEDGKPTVKSFTVNGKRAITSHDSFAQWFRDVPGVNKRIEYAITLKPVAGKPGVYGFKREKPDYFFPIDNAGWGLTGSATDPLVNQQGGRKELKWANPNTRNFHFTYELKTKFTFTPRAEREKDLVFEFTGDDDVWVFINGKLAVDLGGVHGQQQASVNLDQKKAELGLQNDETYELTLFFAERHTSESNFRIETTLQLEEIKPTTVAPTYD